jgi:hypothetical protein
LNWFLQESKQRFLMNSFLLLLGYGTSDLE